MVNGSHQSKINFISYVRLSRLLLHARTTLIETKLKMVWNWLESLCMSDEMVDSLLLFQVRILSSNWYSTVQGMLLYSARSTNKVLNVYHLFGWTWYLLPCVEFKLRLGICVVEPKSYLELKLSDYIISDFVASKLILKSIESLSYLLEIGWHEHQQKIQDFSYLYNCDV